MTPRKTSTTTTLDPAKVCALALKQVKSAADYHRIGSNNPPETVSEAWNHLTEEEQQRLTNLVNNDVQPTAQSIADELSASGDRAGLEATKAVYGDMAIRAAWKLLPLAERDRIKLLCTDQQEKPETAMENPNITQVEKPQPKRTLFTIGEDLEHLSNLLDECGNDAEQINLINDWFSTLGTERDTKLDNYASLISEMQARAAIRKAEGQRMIELAASDELRAKQLKDRLKIFFEQHELKKIDTQRYRLSLCTNSTRPLVIDPAMGATDLPEQYQKVSVEPNTTAIREALKAGVELNFAHLGEAGKHIRIK